MVHSDRQSRGSPRPCLSRHGAYCANFYGSIKCHNTVAFFGDRCKLCLHLKAGTSMRKSLLPTDNVDRFPPPSHPRANNEAAMKDRFFSAASRRHYYPSFGVHGGEKGSGDKRNTVGAGMGMREPAGLLGRPMPYYGGYGENVARGKSQ